MMSDIDFRNLDYLLDGNQMQQRIFTVLKQYKVMELLDGYNPVLIGTFPIDIAVEGSDLDIACCFKDKAEFVSTVITAFGKEAGFELAEVTIGGIDTVVVNFDVVEFPIELFAQHIPVIEQNGYRHMLIEYAILKDKGDAFRQEIVKLKKAGVKTEPAFAQLLGLDGNPYDSLLNYSIRHS
ncbi:DUF4269 domain-containing protein [Myroides marinus]|uniref:DUF4269 domain-containing protein n=1 Tax=Myroides TaxID=76831 RepID=UPI000B2BF9B7|nr:DUF4269 domain-containing protein [Myroides marinus]